MGGMRWTGGRVFPGILSLAAGLALLIDASACSVNLRTTPPQITNAKPMLSSIDVVEFSRAFAKPGAGPTCGQGILREDRYEQEITKALTQDLADALTAQAVAGTVDYRTQAEKNENYVLTGTILTFSQEMQDSPYLCFAPILTLSIVGTVVAASLPVYPVESQIEIEATLQEGRSGATLFEHRYKGSRVDKVNHWFFSWDGKFGPPMRGLIDETIAQIINDVRIAVAQQGRQ